MSQISFDLEISIKGLRSLAIRINEDGQCIVNGMFEDGKEPAPTTMSFADANIKNEVMEAYQQYSKMEAIRVYRDLVKGRTLRESVDTVTEWINERDSEWNNERGY